MADAEGIKVDEVWKSIPGYEGVYSVSSLGRIRREIHYTGSVSGKILKPFSDRNGYKLVDLCWQGVVKKRKVHRIVLAVFSGEMRDLHVNHKNGVRWDNRLENLEWATPSQNQWHSFHVLGQPLRGVAAIGKKPPEMSLREWWDIAKTKH